MNNGKTITFVQLFVEVENIQVPILQRDYAQGRVETKNVRQQFVKSIKNTLLTEPEYLQQPLDLDFVYGSFEDKERELFSVLDGQQRLTTLFLLHWYIAVKENKLTDFKHTFTVNDSTKQKSKFTYKTRVSATEFFDALASSSDITITNDDQLLSDQIIDRKWFFLAWQSDPTVQSCLRMLDTIDYEFNSSPNELYSRIVSAETPYIVFQFLDLHSFGLSDELYIKMNARGKPLTNFENFKAWFCSQIHHTEEGKVLEHKLDQDWLDLFWRNSKDLKQNFDELYLTFFNLMAFYRACEKTNRPYQILIEDEKNWLKSTRTEKGNLPTEYFEANKSFDSKSLNRVSKVLDFLIDDSNALLINFSNAVGGFNRDYVNQIKFYADCLFIENAPILEHWNDNVFSSFRKWQRVTNNLINNHRIDEYVTFIPAVQALLKLVNYADNIYEYLSKDEFDYGFNSEQRAEECLKAQLILQDATWEPLFTEFEKHAYLNGKLGFIINMSVNDDDEYCQSIFSIKASKIARLLSDDILSSDEFLLQRALLTMDDYLIPQGTNKYSFGLPNKGSYRERNENWFSVVKKPVFEKLVNEVGSNIKEGLTSIIERVNCGGWRELIVNNPQTIKYCKRRLIHRIEQKVYLLTKSSFRGYHAELNTYILCDQLWQEQQSGSLRKSVASIGYESVYGNEFPYIQVELKDQNSYRIGHYEEGFFAFNEDSYNDNGTVEPDSLPRNISLIIQASFPEECCV